MTRGESVHQAMQMSARSPGNSKHPVAKAALDPRRKNSLPWTAVDDDNEEVKKSNEFDQLSQDQASHRNLQSGKEETEKERFSTQKNTAWNPMNNFELNKFQDDINFIIEQTGCIREFSNNLSNMRARSEIISQETKRLEAKETELKALIELENKNLQQIKKNVKSLSKILNNLKVSVDVKVQDRKKVMESLANGKASLEACNIELNQ